MEKKKKKSQIFNALRYFWTPLIQLSAIKVLFFRKMFSAWTSTIPVSSPPLGTHQKLTYLSLMVEQRPCQLQHWMVLLLFKFCCWYCCTVVVDAGFLVGKISAAIFFFFLVFKVMISQHTGGSLDELLGLPFLEPLLDLLLTDSGSINKNVRHFMFLPLASTMSVFTCRAVEKHAEKMLGRKGRI